MKKYKFVFDLDSTLTKQEILPEIAKYLNKHEEISKITEETMLGKLSFEESFRKRVDILKTIPIKKVREIIAKIEFNEALVDFIRENIDRCIIVTGNLDIWISELMETLGFENIYYSSNAKYNGDLLDGISKVIKKEEILESIPEDIVAIGDGSNDIGMVKKAQIGIGFGGVRPIAPGLLDVCDYAFYKEERLCQFLKQLL